MSMHPYAFGAILPDPGPPTPPDDGAPHSFTLADLKAGLKQITPTLLIVGVVAGFTFALGSGLASRYVLKGR